MSDKRLSSIIILLLSIQIGTAAEAPPHPDSDTFVAGFAQTELEIPLNHKMLSFPIRENGRIVDDRSNEGTHDPIMIRALVLAEGITSMTLVSVDVALIFDTMIHRVYQRVDGKVSTPSENILIGATHTHHSPVLDLGQGSRATPEWTSHVVDQISRTIVAAHRTLVPARVGFGHGHADLNYNRIFIGPEGKARFIPANSERRFYGPTDKEVVVLRVDHKDGRPFVVVFNYPMHATVMHPSNRLISADFPGPACRIIERSLGPGVAAMYFNGAEGEMNPYDGATKDFKVMERIGETLGKEVLRVHPTIETTTTPGLKLRSRRLEYQDRNDPTQKGTAALSVVLLADATMVSVPGEYFTEAGMEFKRRSPYSNNMILGLTGGTVAYIPHKEAYQYGGYGVDALDNHAQRLGMKQVPMGFAERVWETWLEMIKESPQ